MKVGDLVKVIENDMSLVIPISGMKNNRFFDQVGIILSRSEVYRGEWCEWWLVQFPAGLYEASYNAIEVIHEGG